MSNNDASYSSFGWNFQANAGIYLFLDNITKNETIKIESKKQDIEINTTDGTVLAQAKSTTENTDIGNKDALKKAIVSLATNIENVDKIIYITNFENPLLCDKEMFKNNLINYKYFSADTKKSIDKIFDELKNECQQELIKSKNKNKKERLEKVIKNLEIFPFDKFSVISIYPYFGDDENRYNKIKNKIENVLSNNLNLNYRQINFVSDKLLKYWQNFFEHNSTIKDDEEKNKSINKKKFLWPIIIYLDDIKSITETVVEKSDETYDQADLDDASKYLGKDSFIFYERYDFYKLVNGKYQSFLNENRGQNKMDVKFLNEHYKDFLDDIPVDENEREQVHNFVCRVFVYNAILRRYDIDKIEKGACL